MTIRLPNHHRSKDRHRNMRKSVLGYRVDVRNGRYFHILENKKNPSEYFYDQKIAFFPHGKIPQNTFTGRGLEPGVLTIGLRPLGIQFL